MADDSPDKPRSVTESPWYWIYLFCTAGLIALILAEPKFAVRQAQIERKFQGRQRAIQNLSGQEPRTSLSEPGATAIRLRPLYYVLSGLLTLAWGYFLWSRFCSKSRC